MFSWGDSYRVLRDSYRVLRDSYRVLRDTYSVLRDTYSVLRDTYSVLRDPMGRRLQEPLLLLGIVPFLPTLHHHTLHDCRYQR